MPYRSRGFIALFSSASAWLAGRVTLASSPGSGRRHARAACWQRSLLAAGGVMGAFLGAPTPSQAQTAPSVVSIVRTTPSTQVMRASSVVYTVTFSEPVTNVGVGSFRIMLLNGASTAATVTSVTGGPTVYAVTVTITGGAGEFRLDVGPLVSAFATGFSNPNALVADGAGNLYVADSGNNTVQKITSGGVVSTFASASSPYGITLSAAGDIYVASSSEVKKVTPGGVVSTFATGFNVAGGLAFDSAGNLYVGNYGNSTVSKVTSGGVVSTYLTSINSPFGLTFDSADNLYIAHRDLGSISKVTPGGVLSTYATGFNGPHEMEFDGAGNLYVADRWANRVAKVAPDGTVSTYLGGVSATYGLATDAAGALYVSSYLVDNIVSKITLPEINDADNNLVTPLPYTSGETYLYDPNDIPSDITLSNLSVVQPAASASTIGTLSTTDADPTDTATYSLVSGSGSADNSSFVIVGNTLKVGASTLAAGSYSVRIQTDDGQGATFRKEFVINVVDDVIPQLTSIRRKTPATQTTTATNVVFEVTFAEAVTGVSSSTFAVTALNGSSVVASVVSVTGGPTVYQVTVAVTGGLGDFRLDVTAPAAPDDFNSGLTSPWGLAFDTLGRLYVANMSTNQITRLATDGSATNFATALSSPRGLAFDGSGNLYVANSSNNRVIKIASNGTKTNYATSLTSPRGLAFDATGNLFVSSYSNNSLVQVTLAGTKITVSTGLGNPAGVAFDAAGNLYTASSATNSVKRLTPDGTSGTHATGFSNPEALAFDAAGNLYVANLTGGTVIRLAAHGLVSTVASGLNSPAGLAFDSAGRLYIALNGANKVIRVPLPAINDLAGNSLSGLPFVSGETYTISTNNAPSGMALAPNSVGQSGGTNAVVGNLTTTDADSSDSHTYSLVTGSGDTDNARFNLDGATLRANNAATLAPGSYSIRLRTQDGSGADFENSFTVTVVDDVPPAAPSTPDLAAASDTGSSNTDNLTRLTTPTFTGSADANSEIQLFRNGSTLLGTTTADANGNWTFTVGSALSAGSASITAKAVDSATNVSSASGALLITIDATAPAISTAPTGGTFVAGDSFSLSVVATDSSALSYQWMLDGNALTDTATRTGTTTGTLAQSAISLTGIAGSYTVVIMDAAGNTTTTTPAVIVVTQADQTITFLPLPDRLVTSAPFTLSATASTGLPVTFSVVSGPATLSGETVTVVGAGTVTIRAAQAGDLNHHAAQVDRSFVVSRLTPTIAWPTPAAITYGTPLDGSQLNATTDTPGSLTYTPAAGTILGGGTQVLSVTFTPTDGATYAPSVTTTTLAVTKADQVLQFDPLPDRTFGDPPFALAAHAAASGLPVTFEVVAGPASVTGTTLTLFSGGQVIVRATQAGNANFNPAPPVQQRFSVSRTEATAAAFPADFNGDGKSDLIWSNAITGERAIWLMDGIQTLAQSTLGQFPSEWTIATSGDFNHDGHTDLVWSNSLTGERALWLMQGTNHLATSTLGIFPLEWTVVAAGDFNGDGQVDLVWSNSTTGERAIWLMNGATFLTATTLGTFPLEWTVAAAGDFNGDGKVDLVWSNRLTGERALWLMDGTNFMAASTLGLFPLEWTVVGAGDFNADHSTDILWSNGLTGEHAIWLMRGENYLGAASFGVFPLEWTMGN